MDEGLVSPRLRGGRPLFMTEVLPSDSPLLWPICCWVIVCIVEASDWPRECPNGLGLWDVDVFHGFGDERPSGADWGVGRGRAVVDDSGV